MAKTQTQRELYAAWAERIKAGEQRAFEAFYHDLHPKVYRYCLGFTKSPEMAEEILQEVFVKLWSKREMLNPDLSVQALVYKITRDLTFNFLKKAARDEQLLMEILSYFPQSGNDTEEQVEFNDYWQIAEKAIALLPPQRQRIYKLRREEGMSYEMIAEELGISKNTVKVQLVKASKTIKTYLYTHADLTFLGLFWVVCEVG